MKKIKKKEGVGDTGWLMFAGHSNLDLTSSCESSVQSLIECAVVIVHSPNALQQQLI